MNRNTELKVLRCILIIIALCFISAAWLYEGIINKVGFTLFGVYVLWIVFKKPQVDKCEQINKNDKSCIVTCPYCGCVNVVESGHEDGICYIGKCSGCNQMYGYRFELLVASFEIEDKDVAIADGLDHRAVGSHLRIPVSSTGRPGRAKTPL